MGADQMFYMSTKCRTKVNQFNLQQGAWRLDYQGEHNSNYKLSTEQLAEEECSHHHCTSWRTDVGVLDLLVLQNNQKLNFEGYCKLQSFLNISGCCGLTPAGN